MESSDCSGVYNLITELCEKFASNRDIVGKLRTTVYEILLKKRSACFKPPFKELKGPDVFSNVLVWQFMLAHKYDMVEHGNNIKDYAEYVHECYGDSVLRFLMCLRNIPNNNADCFEFDEDLSLTSFLTGKSTVQTVVVEERSPCTSPDIWELAAKEEFNPRKNWENFGHSEPAKEKPFLSELGANPTIWVENLPSVYFGCVTQAVPQRPVVKSMPDFVTDIKYLLVGMASYSFVYNESGAFSMAPNLTVSGLTPETLKTYCEDYVLAGECYKVLHEISTPNPYSGEYKQEGFIFKELCKSIRRYLEFYRTAVLRLPKSFGLLRLHERSDELRRHLTTLAKICKLGPYSNSSKIIPHGVSLLNYLYQSVLNLTDKTVHLVLYSILFPCCQVYLNRFLQQWLLEGAVNDPYEEFFIKPNFKYISTRGRTYWTRSFVLREDRVPDFLLDLRLDILNCGKTMNLLRSCFQSSKLCLYLMGNKPSIVSCCLTSEQLMVLEQRITSYYLDVSAECGPKINLEHIVRRKKELNPNFMALIAKKRAATLRRIELVRKKQIEEDREKKLDEITALKEQYDSALIQKQLRCAADIEIEIKQIEFSLSASTLRDKLIEREAQEMIEYYNDLFAISEARKNKIEKHIEVLKSISLEHTVPISTGDSFHSIDNVEIDIKSDTESLQSMHTAKSLDVLNANAEEEQEQPKMRPVELSSSLETFELARNFKAKVLEVEEMGRIGRPPILNVTSSSGSLDQEKSLSHLTDAQRNKLKVLSSEFALKPLTSNFRTKKPDRKLNQTEVNRNFMMTSNEVFWNREEKLDNSNYVNRNVIPESRVITKSTSLSLDINKSVNDNNSNLTKPMSLDSTPLSDMPLTPATSGVSVENKTECESACTLMTDEGFIFDEVNANYATVEMTPGLPKPGAFSKRVTPDEVSTRSTNCLKLFLHQSISVPLATQTKLVNNELLKNLVDELHYFKHLNNLRDYFFLQDGEFARSITENMFEKLYDVHLMREFVNFRTLHNLVRDALNNSCKFDDDSSKSGGELSFRINSMPKILNLGDPDVLDCLSLTYRVKWPLNILLPIDTIGKYDEVFKFLMKLNRISWVLKKIFLEMKILAKETGKKEIYLMMSPHYRRLHQCRHIMLHFVQTLQNYVLGEVLQSSWEIFEQNLASVTDLDSLYIAHTTYLKNILFLCLLNQKSTPLRKVINRIFTVILKFYDHLRSRSWTCVDGVYVHPNFTKLESIFLNFEEFVMYLFRVGRKVARCGYQPHLAQFLDMLDINGYYSKTNN